MQLLGRKLDAAGSLGDRLELFEQAADRFPDFFLKR